MLQLRSAALVLSGLLAGASVGAAAYAHHDLSSRSRTGELEHMRALARTTARSSLLATPPSAATTFWLNTSLRSLELAEPEVVSARVVDTAGRELARVDRGTLVPTGSSGLPAGASVAAALPGRPRVELTVRPRVRGASWLEDLPVVLALGALAALGSARLPLRRRRAGAGADLVADIVADSPGWQSAEVLLKALEARDPRLAEHLHDVSELALEVGRRLGLEGDELETLGQAAALHDIGKVAVPDAILRKPAPLDEEEWALVRQHPIVGERIVAAAPALAPAAPIVRTCHERFDGTGYPEGLEGEAIPVAARVIAVCAAWEAMAGRRPYRIGLTRERALAELRRGAGTQFDPGVVDTFVAVLDDVERQRRSRLRLVA